MLSAECDREIGLLMNNAVKESQRAISQAEGVAKLTRLAFFFIPLSLTSSFFGMNFSQLVGAAGAILSIWLWFAVSAPVLAASFAFLIWDLPDDLWKVVGALRRVTGALHISKHNASRMRTGRRSEQVDEIHV